MRKALRFQPDSRSGKVSITLVTYLFCLYVSIASAMGNWCAQFAPAIYCVILETTSGVSGTATEQREKII